MSNIYLIFRVEQHLNNTIQYFNVLNNTVLNNTIQYSTLTWRKGLAIPASLCKLIN